MGREGREGGVYSVLPKALRWDDVLFDMFFASDSCV